jgi:adenylylsulfate kinase
MSKNLFYSHSLVSADERAALLQQKGCLLWFTGLSGSGKSTLARALEKELFARRRLSYILDGDNIRHGLNSDLGFGDEDRRENLRRIGEVARLFVDAGLITITAFISPFRQVRDQWRAALGPGRFFEIYVKAALAVCEQRDPKGLYRQARAGTLTSFTGLDSSYEAPENPDLELDTEQVTVPEAVARLLQLLSREGIF